MYSPYIRIQKPICLPSLNPSSLQLNVQLFESRFKCGSSQRVGEPWKVLLLLLILVALVGTTGANAQPVPPASGRITISLSDGVPNFVGNAAATAPSAALPQSNWWYENNQDSATFAAPNYLREQRHCRPGRQRSYIQRSGNCLSGRKRRYHLHHCLRQPRNHRQHGHDGAVGFLYQLCQLMGRHKRRLSRFPERLPAREFRPVKSISPGAPAPPGRPAR